MTVTQQLCSQPSDISITNHAEGAERQLPPLYLNAPVFLLYLLFRKTNQFRVLFLFKDCIPFSSTGLECIMVEQKQF